MQMDWKDGPNCLGRRYVTHCPQIWGVFLDFATWPFSCTVSVTKNILLCLCLAWLNCFSCSPPSQLQKAFKRDFWGAGKTGKVLCTCMCFENTDGLEPCAQVWFSVLTTSVCPGSYLQWLYLFFKEFLKPVFIVYNLCNYVVIPTSVTTMENFNVYLWKPQSEYIAYTAWAMTIWIMDVYFQRFVFGFSTEGLLRFLHVCLCMYTHLLYTYI